MSVVCFTMKFSVKLLQFLSNLRASNAPAALTDLKDVICWDDM